MKAILSTIVLLTLAAGPLLAQPVTLRPVCKLPALLEETSGLEITQDYTFWSHNDSGGEPEVYMFDSTGTYFRSMRLANASNVDWEELAQDDAGNFYIGDFGNNDNKRKNLRIYKIPNPLPMSTVETSAEIIEFSYADQTAFPPAGPYMNYDMEAMFWHAGALYLFSKNRTNPYNGIVYVYKIPDTPGTYSVARVDSFDTGGTSGLTSSATSADISPDGSTVALLSYGRMWLMTDFTGDAFFSGNAQQIDFTATTQTEAICFASNSELYITDELVGGLIGGMLYKLDLSSIVGVEDVPDPEGFLLDTYPNPFTTTLYVASPGWNAHANLRLYNTAGRCVYHSALPGGSFSITPPRAAVPAGLYLAVVQTANSVATSKVLRK